MAGIYARLDAQHGVWKAPAGTGAVVTGATALAVQIGTPLGNAMNAAGINALRSLPNQPILVWGARTLPAAGGDASYQYVPVRRLMLFIETSIEAGLAWTALEPNVATTWAAVSAAIGAWLTGLWRQGALQGAKPAQAWYVRCDATTMTPADIAAGRLIVMVGIAALRPAEFVVLRIVMRTAT